MMLFISLSQLGRIILSTVNELLEMVKIELANLTDNMFLVIHNSNNEQLQLRLPYLHI